MSKTFIIVLGIIILIGVCLWFCPCRKAMTCPIQGLMEHKGQMMGCPIKGQGAMAGEVRASRMEAMLEKKVLLTPEGGLFVVLASKIIKYDKDLNLVKEVELTPALGVSRNVPIEMKKDCPMMKGTLKSKEVNKP